MIKWMIAGMMLLGGVFAAQAQPGGFGGPGGQMDPEQMATRQADQMKQSLKLTDQQYTKVVAVFKEQMESMQKMMQGGQRPDMEAMQKVREEQEKKLKDILTADQFKTWQEEQANRRGGFGGPGGPGGRPGGPRMMRFR